MATQAERTDATTGQLLDAARRLFGEQGYANTATEDIVRDAKVTRGALYHHYANKLGLFEAVFEQEERLLAERIMKAANKVDGPAEGVRVGFRVFLDACLTPEFQRIALLDAPAVLGTERVREIEYQYTFGMLSHALETASHGRLTPLDLEARGRLLMGAICEAGLYVAGAERPRAALKAVTGQLDLLIDGILASGASARRRPA